ncbi:MAG TPA: c-type cytochrome, partial [Kofleriaceae bacterium]|nr:c-type cytochrome [Kofleriaceae bacterium]
MVAIASVAVVAAWGWPTPPSPQMLPGWAIYDRYCLACHGSAGDGHGPAAPYTWGQPRSFASGEYEWRSTPVGQPPSDDDLRAAIRFGAPGTSMPAFDGVLSPGDIDAAVAVVKAFAPASFVKSGSPVALPARPPGVATRGDELWTRLGCASCHGAGGRGDGPAAAKLAERPYDFTTDPLRRPREADDLDARRRAAAMSIATGMTGTAMPGYAGAMSDADLWTLADRVVTLGLTAKRVDRSSLDADEIAADTKLHIVAGTWPSRGDDAVVFGSAIAPQGPPPPSLAPAQASLEAARCARCHAKQYREWQGSIHARAGSPGLVAQLDHGMPPSEATSCRRCHAPLAEQATDPVLRADGVSCAGCHVRNWVRHGPPRIAATLLQVPSYPLVTLAIYERADMCMACHQLPPRLAVAGRPLLNTYKEWLEGPYMRRGVECQHCHMPDREHAFKGIHDRDTFRQGIRLVTTAHRTTDAVTVDAELTNAGAGHYLPTTPTPAAWLTVELLDR